MACTMLFWWSQANTSRESCTLFQCKRSRTAKAKRAIGAGQQNNSRYLWIVIDSRIVALAALGIRRSHTSTFVSLHNYDHVCCDQYPQAKYEFQNCHKFLWQIIKCERRVRFNRLRALPMVGNCGGHVNERATVRRDRSLLSRRFRDSSHLS